MEGQKYVEYLEDEIYIIRERLDELNVFNTGSIADDIISYIDSVNRES